ncbi:hypothetical protein KKG83_03580 [Candidatus Micrarchaeota archaeon]|nr:hypothetical protein [Candidatus Micrarchaeota archaeon]
MNYVKPVLIERLNRVSPPNAIIIRDFLLFCLDKKIPLNTCDTVYHQIKYYKTHYREEFMKKGISFRNIERVMQVAERKIKNFLAKIKIHESLLETRYSEVKNFFIRFIDDKRMINLMKKKESSSPLPEDSDMKIFSKALSFPELWFVTTDGHFKELTNEIEKAFTIELVTDDNAFRKKDKLSSCL